MNTETIKAWAQENKATLWGVFAIVATFAFMSAAQAGAGGTQFQPIWTEISSWLDGVPGKIVTALAFGFALANVVRQNYMGALASLFGCLLLANAVEIINSFMTAGLPVGA